MKNLTLIPDNKAEALRGGYFSTSFNVGSFGATSGTNQKNIVNLGQGLIGIGSFKLAI